MRTSRTRQITMSDGALRTELILGHGTANSLAYMLEGFLDWRCFGIVRVGGPHRFGLHIDGIQICAVYGSEHSLKLLADDPREKDQIAAGRTSVLLFRGIDSSSYMRRLTPQQYAVITITEFSHEDDDLYYNS
jgi:hypothetical protein